MALESNWVFNQIIDLKKGSKFPIINGISADEQSQWQYQNISQCKMNPIPLEGDINQIPSTISRDFHRRNVPATRVSNKWKVYKGQTKFPSK